jgi:flagellar hook-associated protein 1 FlgK
MSGILSSIQMAGNALLAHSRAMQVTQNNLVNASTPGYARQYASLSAEPFDPAQGLAGGVRFAGVYTSRSEFAESGVRAQTSLYERDQQLAQMLAAISPWLDSGDVSSPAGLAGAYHTFKQALTAWANAPDDVTVRQRVIDEAGGLARSFRDAAAGIETVRQQGLAQLRNAVDQVNRILADLNQMQQGFSGDAQPPDASAPFYASLEELSTYLDIQVSKTPEGKFTVTTNSGGALLLSGNQIFPLSVSVQAPSPGDAFSGGAPIVKLVAGATDISEQVKGGQIGGLLEGLTQVIPSLIGDGRQEGDLNRLARELGARVNSILTSGRTPGNPPAAGIPLFQWSSAGGAATALTVNPQMSATKLATLPGASDTSGKSIPAQLLGLLDAANPTGKIMPEGLSVGDFLASLTAKLGGEQASVEKAGEFHKQLLEQARSIRERASGVSLEEEAVNLLQFQRSFEAISKVISVLNEMADATLALVR